MPPVRLRQLFVPLEQQLGCARASRERNYFTSPHTQGEGITRRLNEENCT
jgi:hypothetical protein